MASSEGWNTPGKSMLDDAPAQEGLSVEGGGLQPSRSKTLRKNPIFMGLVASVVVQALVIGAFLLGNNWVRALRHTHDLNATAGAPRRE